MNVFSMLESDHRRVERLLDQLSEREEGAERERLVGELGAALEVHMRFEEESIYPRLAEVDREAVQEAENEHELARDGLSKMRQLVTEPGFGAALEMVTAGISHHVEDEEGEAFPKLRNQLDEGIQRQLGDSLMQAKRDAGLPEPKLEDASKKDLMSMAQEAGIEGRSQMTKEQLRDALSSRA